MFALNATAQHECQDVVPNCCYTFHFELRCVTVLPGLAALLATHVLMSSFFLALPLLA